MWGCVVLGGWLVSSCYGGHSIEETPGSIPNPEAKLDCADGTALGRVWESRSPPDIFMGVEESLSPLGFASSTPFFHARNRLPAGVGSPRRGIDHASASAGLVWPAG